MITLGTFKPQYFNQNGDQGNLESLGMQLMWRGIECQVSEKNLEAADFLLVGDASRAAMRHFEEELVGLIPMLSERLADGLPTLLVGSAHEFFSGRLPGLPKLNRIARASEFREVAAGELRAFGYRNSEFDSDLFTAGAFISTSLFGPVLAKSPALLELVLDRLGVKEPLPSEISEELACLVEEIRTRAISG